MDSLGILFSLEQFFTRISTLSPLLVHEKYLITYSPSSMQNTMKSCSSIEMWINLEPTLGLTLERGCGRDLSTSSRHLWVARSKQMGLKYAYSCSNSPPMTNTKLEQAEMMTLELMRGSGSSATTSQVRVAQLNRYTLRQKEVRPLESFLSPPKLKMLPWGLMKKAEHLMLLGRYSQSSRTILSSPMWVTSMVASKNWWLAVNMQRRLLASSQAKESLSWKMNSSRMLSSGTTVSFLIFCVCRSSRLKRGVLNSKQNINLPLSSPSIIVHSSFSREDRKIFRLFSMSAAFSMFLPSLKTWWILSEKMGKAFSSASCLARIFSESFSQVLQVMTLKQVRRKSRKSDMCQLRGGSHHPWILSSLSVVKQRWLTEMLRWVIELECRYSKILQILQSSRTISMCDSFLADALSAYRQLLRVCSISSIFRNTSQLLFSHCTFTSYTSTKQGPRIIQLLYLQLWEFSSWKLKWYFWVFSWGLLMLSSRNGVDTNRGWQPSSLSAPMRCTKLQRRQQGCPRILPRMCRQFSEMVAFWPSSSRSMSTLKGWLRMGNRVVLVAFDSAFASPASFLISVQMAKLKKHSKFMSRIQMLRAASMMKTPLQTSRQKLTVRMSTRTDAISSRIFLSPVNSSTMSESLQYTRMPLRKMSIEVFTMKQLFSRLLVRKMQSEIFLVSCTSLLEAGENLQRYCSRRRMSPLRLRHSSGFFHLMGNLYLISMSLMELQLSISNSLAFTMNLALSGMYSSSSSSGSNITCRSSTQMFFFFRTSFPWQTCLSFMLYMKTSWPCFVYIHSELWAYLTVRLKYEHAQKESVLPIRKFIFSLMVWICSCSSRRLSWELRTDMQISCRQMGILGGIQSPSRHSSKERQLEKAHRTNAMKPFYWLGWATVKLSSKNPSELNATSEGVKQMLLILLRRLVTKQSRSILISRGCFCNSVCSKALYPLTSSTSSELKGQSQLLYLSSSQTWRPSILFSLSKLEMQACSQHCFSKDLLIHTIFSPTLISKRAPLPSSMQANSSSSSRSSSFSSSLLSLGWLTSMRLQRRSWVVSSCALGALELDPIIEFPWLPSNLIPFQPH